MYRRNNEDDHHQQHFRRGYLPGSAADDVTTSRDFHILIRRASRQRYNHGA